MLMDCIYNFIETFFITFATVSQPISVKIVIFNSQFTHFSDEWILIFFYYFQFVAFQSASNIDMYYLIAFKLHNNILHHICYSIQTIPSEILIFNSQFSTGAAYRDQKLYCDISNNDI